MCIMRGIPSSTYASSHFHSLYSSRRYGKLFFNNSLFCVINFYFSHTYLGKENYYEHTDDFISILTKIADTLIFICMAEV